MPASDLAVTKVADSASTGVVEPGDPVRYTMTVTNNGPDAVVGARFVDPVPSGLSFGAWSCAPSNACGTTSGNGAITTDLRLAVGERATLTLAATVRTGATDSTVDNTASAMTPVGVNDPDRTNDAATADLTMSNPVLGLVKTVRDRTDLDGDGVVSRGDQLTYQFVVTNSGNKALAAVSVTDPMAGLSAVSCPATTLAVGGSMTCTATYRVTQADVDAGTVDNRATARAVTASGVPATSASSAASVVVPQRPAIGLVKTLGSYDDADADHAVSRGDTLVYRFAVTNSGNVTLHGVAVSDTIAGLSEIVCPLTILAPGSSTSCSATRVVTQADVDRGSIVNTATASGLAPAGTTVGSAPSAVTVPIQQHPAVRLAKRFGGLSDVDGDQRASAGDLLTYRFDVTNSGDVTLTDIAVHDGLAGLSAVQCPTTTVAPGATVSCAASAPVDQAWLDAGQVVNQATASATPPSGPPLTSPASTVTVPLAAAPAVTLAKSLAGNDDADHDGKVSRGDRLTFQLVITNSGNVTMHDVSISDPLPGLTPVMCPATVPAGTLAPGRSLVCTTTYAVTQSTVDAGSLVNTAIARGTPPSGPSVDSSATATVSVPQHPALTLHKTVRPRIDADNDGTTSVGDTLEYRFDLHNTGDVTLASAYVTDGLAGLSGVDCPVVVLAPDATATCTATYVVRQADVEAGTLTNTATASALSPLGLSTTSPPDGATVSFARTAGLSLRKSVASVTDADGDGVTEAGDTVTFELLVANTGNVRVEGITVDDPLVGLSPVHCPVTVLAPHTATICSATYTLRQADVDAGVLRNSATVSGNTGHGDAVQAGPASTSVAIALHPALTLVKSVASVSRGDASSLPTIGSTLNYRFVVTNAGNVTLRNVVVTDPMNGLSALQCPTSTIAPGGSVECTATYRVTRFDTARVWVTNTATASGTGPSGAAVTSAPSTARIQMVDTPEPSSPYVPPTSTVPGTTVPTTSGPVTSGPVTSAPTERTSMPEQVAAGAVTPTTVPTVSSPGSSDGSVALGASVAVVSPESESAEPHVDVRGEQFSSRLALTGSPARRRTGLALGLMTMGALLLVGSRRGRRGGQRRQGSAGDPTVDSSV